MQVSTDQFQKLKGKEVRIRAQVKRSYSDDIYREAGYDVREDNSDCRKVVDAKRKLIFWGGTDNLQSGAPENRAEFWGGGVWKAGSLTDQVR